MSRKTLPPLEVGALYRIPDFERFEFGRSVLTGEAPILRLHLTNGTILEIPASDTSLRVLRNVLMAAYPLQT